MSDKRLCIDLLGIKIKNPVIAASGTFGFGDEMQEFYDTWRAESCSPLQSNLYLS